MVLSAWRGVQRRDVRGRASVSCRRSGARGNGWSATGGTSNGGETLAAACLALAAVLCGLRAAAGVGDAVVAAMVKAGAAGRARSPGSVFRDHLSGGGEGPAMAVIPAGRFRMGCLSDDDACLRDEKPVHEVAIPAPFALSVREVTFADYDRFTNPDKVRDSGWGRGRRPVINVSWNDAQDYVE